MDAYEIEAHYYVCIASLRAWSRWTYHPAAEAARANAIGFASRDGDADLATCSPEDDDSRIG